MEIKVTKNKIHLDDKSKLNENEYNINNIDFTFSEEYTQELVKIALFSANNTNYKEIITQNQCKIPSEILANEGVFVLGVYAYSTEDVYKLTEDTEIDEDKTYYIRTGSGTEEEPYEYTEVENPIAENLSTYYEKNVKLSLRYSPSPIKLVVDSGSYIPDEQTQNSEPITASELEQYQQALNDGLREAENVNISAEKVDKVATITIIDRYGDETSVEIQDGTDGIDGKDAKINGVNTLTIKAGQNIEIEQEENTLIINGQSNYNNLTNKPKINNVELTGNKTTSDLGIVIPDVSGFITKDVNNLTNYTLKTATGSLIDLEINQSTYVVTLTLKDIDGNVISTDTIDLPLESVVVGGSYDATNKKIVLTLENGNTVDIPVGDLIAGLQTEITSQNKLASDLVDDSNSGNKFVTTSEKQTWNAKYDKPAGGIPKTDLASAVQTSLDKADTAVQDVSDKEDISNKVTEIDETSTDDEYPSAKLLYDELAEKQEQIDGLVTENALLKDQIPNGTAEGTNVQITDSSNLPIEDGVIKGDTSQVQYEGYNLFDIGEVSDYSPTGRVTSTANNILTFSVMGQGGTDAYNTKTNFAGNTTYTIIAKTSVAYSRYFVRLRNSDDTAWLTGDDATITGWSYNQYYGGWYKDNPSINVNVSVTIPECLYCQFGFGYSNNVAQAGETQTISEIQVEQGSTAHDYEPYTGGQPSPNPDYKQDIHTVTGDCNIKFSDDEIAEQNAPLSLGDIELCEIGDYQDYLFKNVRTLRSGRANPLFNADLDEGAWYEYSAMGKVVLDGSEAWGTIWNDSEKNLHAWEVSISDSIIYPDNLEVINPILCDNFKTYGQAPLYNNQGAGKSGIAGRRNTNHIFIENNDITTLTDFKTWLGIHNTTVYYVLATPTYTKITDTTLIAQLEAYYNSSTYRNVTNIITAGEDLAPIASIVYKKDLTTLFNKLDSLEARVDLLE